MSRKNDDEEKDKENHDDFTFIKSDFQALWFKIQKEASIEQKKAIIKTVLVSKN